MTNRYGLSRVGLLVVIVGLTGVLISFGLHVYFMRVTRASGGTTTDSKEDMKVQVWTCSMHPQIRMPKPGKCPICFMDLIPSVIREKEEGEKKAELTLNEDIAKLIEIETSIARRSFVPMEIRMFGKVSYDETRVFSITAWVAGRVDKLFINYTGSPICRGDPMLMIYSPDLISAQEEFLQALRIIRTVGKSSQNELETGNILTAAREKLRLLGLTREQIKELELRGKIESEHVIIHAPSSGIVIQKEVLEGTYVDKGTTLYRVADLSNVWVVLNAYESDVAWLRYGQKVSFTLRTYPGEVFHGAIVFIQPVLDGPTRTVKVRVNVPNADGRLKPEMFVHGLVQVQVDGSGRILSQELAGKWICGVHPEVVRNQRSKCDICGTELVSTETLGYLGSEIEASDIPLVIPDTAPLLTGKRAVVYIQRRDGKKLIFEGREVSLGAHVGQYYIVKSGLSEGERVVVKGNFKLDAELQLKAKPSMMSMEEPAITSASIVIHAAHEKKHKGMDKDDENKKTVKDEFNELGKGGYLSIEDIDILVRSYLDIQNALALDEHSKATQSADNAVKKIVIMISQARDSNNTDKTKLLTELQKHFSAISTSSGIELSRSEFAILSVKMGEIFKHSGVSGITLYEVWCPMAFDNRGAFWFQDKEEISNPYFGKAMLRCGEIRRVLK